MVTPSNTNPTLMPKLFLISGLGADKTAFARLGEFGIEKVMIDWIPNKPNESLADYAKRLIGLHKITGQDKIAGLSFGGLHCARDGISITDERSYSNL